MATVNVTSGEICTASAAQQYGIYHPTNILQPAYSDTRTYSSKVVNDHRRPKRLCTEEPNGAYATKVCSVEYGYGFTAKNNDQCIAGARCPPNFTEDSGNPSRCRKQIIEKEFDKSQRCDEKWYDWFTVENYHLGNKYETVGGKCMKPCTPDQIPMYVVDPVDGKAVNDRSFEDRSQCVHRDDYLNGKYSGESDFCPLAWIHRLGATKEGIQAKLQSEAGTENAKQNPAFKSALESRLRDVDAAQVLQQCNTYLENIGTPSTAMDLACSKSSFQTKERVNEAYDICRKVLNDESGLKQTWHQDGINTAEETNVKMEVLKQACDKMFCYKNTNLPLLLRKPSICFRTRNQNVRSYNEGGRTAEDRRFHVLSADRDAADADAASALPLFENSDIGTMGLGDTSSTDLKRPHSIGRNFTKDFSQKAKLYLRWLILGFIGLFMLMIIVKIAKIMKIMMNQIEYQTSTS